MNAKQVAMWLYNKVLDEEVVFQYHAVREIEEKFGEKFVYINKNGNKAINEKVTKAFREINVEGKVQWDALGYKWVLMLSDDEAEDLLKKL
ncbi:DUF6953 family protein [Paenibacillus elgii]|uniref:DUF6953 family protein n=1 Tax=Paenibacillus elgii TaxID=189691 RepID=UPI00203CC075|nr:hypothetical protein [Paenibacillus elgii]MCM3274214.1 hypothetical protein [Paenibacillus elgii]